MASHMTALASPDWRVRRDAVAGLVSEGGTDAVDAIMRGLAHRHRDPGTLNGVLQALAAIRADVVAPLSAMLRDSDTDLRIYAAHALALTLDLRAIPPLIAALDDPDLNVVYHAIESLGQLKAGEASERLTQIAESRDFSVALTALSALAAIEDSSIAPRLVPLLDDELLRDAVLETLGAVGDLETVEPIVTCLDRDEVSVFTVANTLTSICRRMRAFGLPEEVPTLVAGLVADRAKQRLIDSAKSVSGSDIFALATVLGWLHDEATIVPLMTLFDRFPGDGAVVEAIIRKGRVAIQPVAARLHSADIQARQTALFCLSQIGDQQSAASIREVLSDPEVTAKAVIALALIGDPHFKPAIQELLGHPEASVRRVVVSALNSLGSLLPAEVDRGMTSESAAVRESVTRICGYARIEEHADQLLERCRDENADVRRAAIETITLLDDERAFAALVPALADRSDRVRIAAARGLAGVTNAAADSALLDAVNDADPRVRSQVIRSLGIRRCTSARDIFVEFAANDPAVPVRIEAIDAMACLSDQALEPVLTEWAQSADADVACAAIRRLGRLGTPSAQRIVRAALNSSVMSVRDNAIRSLASSGSSSAVEPLAEVAAGDPDSTLRLLATISLLRIRDSRAVDAAIRLLERPDLRSAVVCALAGLAEDHVSWLESGLRHPSVDVRRSVVAALGQIPSTTAMELLQSAVGDPARIVRLAAMRAIGHHRTSAKASPSRSTSTSGEAG